MEDFLRRLGRRIREIRIQKGFRSQEEFADYCKMHRTFLGHLETGRKDFRLTTIIRVSEALGVTMQDLFTGLEAGESFKPKRIARQVDTEAVLRELTALERSVENLKEITLRQSHHKTTKKRAQNKKTLRR